MAAHARLKNDFTKDEKYHNLMSWLNFCKSVDFLGHFSMHYSKSASSQENLSSGFRLGKTQTGLLSYRD